MTGGLRSETVPIISALIREEPITLLDVSSDTCIIDCGITGLLHGVVKVAHHTGSLSGSGVPEAGVVRVADDSLYPGQSARGWHGLVGKMAYRRIV